MSKRKLATASKRGGRNPKKDARAQRNKQAIIRSPAAVSIRPALKLHDKQKYDDALIETRVDALPSDLSQRMRDTDAPKGFALATANMQAFQAKLLEIAQSNWRFAFEFGLRLAAIKSPAAYIALITEFTSRRIDMFGQHAKEMAAYPFWRIDGGRRTAASKRLD
jgi:phasin protein